MSSSQEYNLTATTGEGRAGAAVPSTHGHGNGRWMVGLIGRDTEVGDDTNGDGVRLSSDPPYPTGLG